MSSCSAVKTDKIFRIFIKCSFGAGVKRLTAFSTRFLLCISLRSIHLSLGLNSLETSTTEQCYNSVSTLALSCCYMHVISLRSSQCECNWPLKVCFENMPIENSCYLFTRNQRSTDFLENKDILSKHF